MKKFTVQEIKEFVSKLLFDEKVIIKKDSSYPKIYIFTPSYNRCIDKIFMKALNSING